jgi:leucine dehydrogenase
VLVQGAGNVGQYLMGHLVEEDAKVFICDINEEKVKQAVGKYPKLQVVDNNTIFDLDFDIYAPCALGATVNTETINKMKCPVIAGGANNQLADENVHGPMLVKKGIIYVPDFVINAGGIINISIEIDGYNKDRAWSTVAKIYDRTLQIFSLAEQEGVHTQLAANRMAEKRLNDIAKLRVGI